jgi:zinc protease
LEVILHRDPATPVVAVDLWYRVGSKDETPDATGFAHLFEHLMFQGSRHFPTDYIAALQELGADVNGGTTYDRTSYHEVVPRNSLELALAMESDRMGYLLEALSDAKLATQKDVVVNEFRQQYLNRPYGMTWQWLAETVYPADHPYSWMTIGKPEHVQAAGREQVESFFRRWYTPDNAALCLSGDIDPSEALALADRYFGDIPRRNGVGHGHAGGNGASGNGSDRSNGDGELRRRDDRSRWAGREMPPPPVAPLVRKDRVTLPRLHLAWHTVPVMAPDDAELDVVGDVLARGKTSRLYKTLVYDRQIAQSVSADHWSRELGGLFYVVVTAKPGVTLDVLREAVDAELDALRETGPRPDELQRIWNRREAGFYYGLQSVLGKADRLSAYNLITGDPAECVRDLERYRRVTAEDVLRVARRYLSPERRYEMRIVPG